MPPLSVTEQQTAQFTREQDAKEICRIGRFFYGELQNFSMWPAEFGKIFFGKLGPTD